MRAAVFGLAHQYCKLQHPNRNHPISFVCTILGFLPRTWAAMPPLVPANDVDLSFNDLMGPILDSWGNHTPTMEVGAGFNSLKVASNPRMCGALPAWFTLRFGGNPLLMAQMYNGT